MSPIGYMDVGARQNFLLARNPLLAQVKIDELIGVAGAFGVTIALNDAPQLGRVRLSAVGTNFDLDFVTWREAEVVQVANNGQHSLDAPLTAD